MHITEVIKQEVAPPDIVKYQGAIKRPLTASQPRCMGTTLRAPAAAKKKKKGKKKAQLTNVNAICLF